MKKNISILLAIACIAALSLQLTKLNAQATNEAVTAPAMTPPGAPPGAPPMQRPPMRNRNLYSIRAAVMTLNRAINDLQHSDNDFDGHRQAAIDACKQANEELQAIAKLANIPLGPPPGRPMPPPGAMRPPPAPQAGGNGAVPPPPSAPPAPANPQ